MVLTHPVFRGTGIGKRLLKTAIDYCREKDYDNVFLLTTSIQQRAIGMYKKPGLYRLSQLNLISGEKHYMKNVLI